MVLGTAYGDAAVHGVQYCKASQEQRDTFHRHSISGFNNLTDRIKSRSLWAKGMDDKSFTNSQEGRRSFQPP